MWSAVATGIPLFSVFYHDLPHGLGNSIFLGLGWLAGASGFVLWRRLGTRGIGWLIGGGVAYSIGALCMGLNLTVIPGVVSSHELWHVAVLAAMAMHWTFFYSQVQGTTGR